MNDHLSFSSDRPNIVRPDGPREEIAERNDRFQFPRSLLLSLNTPFAMLSNRGLLPGFSAKCHVVMCGFPRSGTTLCQLMVQTCVENLRCYRKERRALQIARHVTKRDPFLFTKRPKDIFEIEEIRQFYQPLKPDVKFILFTRDPRDVLTSVHRATPDRYFVTPELWKAIYEHWLWAEQFPDTMTVRYEDLVSQTDEIEQMLADRIGWQVTRPFRKFVAHTPSNFDQTALNGLRAVDPSNIQRWRKPKYHSRIRQLLESEMPDLPDLLIDLGYESNHDWVSEYRSRAAA